MNIAVLSSRASSGLLAKLLSRQNNTKVFHIGANELEQSTDSYVPIPMAFKVEKELLSLEQMKEIYLAIKKIDGNIDFVISFMQTFHEHQLLQKLLTSLNVKSLCPEYQFSKFETNRTLTKELFNELGIPTPTNFSVTSVELQKQFNSIKTPFVIKLNNRYLHGRQTNVITEQNKQEIFDSLFGDTKTLISANPDDTFVVEEYIEIEKEYSYHALINNVDWKYVGSARDYKQIYDGDNGPNGVSMGAYNVIEVETEVHIISKKICDYFQKLGYIGFLFIGFAIDKNGKPYVLELNTRFGDPEIQVILESINNDLSDLFSKAVNNESLPDIQFNDKKIVTIRIVNKNLNWKEETDIVPVFLDVPNTISYSIEGIDNNIQHSVLLASGETHHESSNIIYSYLKTQDLKNHTYRTDIGILP
jgi:phosphoribosylamine--glycine ligase